MNPTEYDIQRAWQTYLAALPPDHPHRTRPLPAAWSFGDSPDMADELGGLVCAGIKTATCSLMWGYEMGVDPMPQEGDLSLILDGRGRVMALIETVELRQRAYEDVDAVFAAEEGEDDRSLQSWREGHWRYFTRECQTLGRTFTPQAPVLCERFRLVWRAGEV